MVLRSLTFAAVAAASLTSAPALAQVQVGILECVGGPSVGYIVGSQTALNCVFRPSTRRGPEGYAAYISRVGLDIGVTGTTGMSWLVFAPARDLGRGALAGSYGGVSANASLVVGGGANVLVGGSNRSITLQPVSVQGQTGINLAAGVTNLELRSTTPARTIRKKSSKKKRS